MASHLYIEILFICISFFAIMLYRVFKVNDKRTSQLYFRVLLECSILCFCFDLAQAVVTSIDPTGNIPLLYVLHIMYYLMLGAMAYFWFLYSECEQGSRFISSRLQRELLCIPLYIMGVFAVTAPFNHLMFYVDDAGMCQRGPMHFVQTFVCFIYILSTSVKAFVLAAKAKSYARRSRLMVTGSLIIPTIICAVLQVIWPTLPILCAGTCDSLLFGYIAMQEQHVSVDPLTKVNNRRRFIQNVESLIAHAKDDHAPFGLLIVDVDKFKGINDTYGHVEGDRALVHIAQAISNIDEEGLRVYRYGGDEFVVTSEQASDEALSRIAGKMQAAVAHEGENMGVPYKLSVSVGYTRFELTDAEPADIVNRADSKLYEEKHGKQAQVQAA